MILITKTFKIKIVIGGEGSFEKNSFLNRTSLVEEEIGVSFKSLECLVNETDSYKLIMWDLNPAKDIFGFMYPQFCRGAKACFLFFDFSKYTSLKGLPYWINLFRKTLGFEIPIILIGTIPEPKIQEVFEEDIQKVIKKYHLYPNYYVISNDSNKKRKKKTIFTNLIRTIDPEIEIKKFKIISPCEDPEFIAFFVKFSKCPICNRQNHERYLQDLYYCQDDEEKSTLRDYLLNLVEYSKHFFQKYSNKIKIGIPCCSCYRLIFEH